MMISFLGTLPLGTLNISAMQIAVSDGIPPAIKFAIGALIVEVIYVRISLVAMKWVSKNQRVFRIFEWLTVAIIFALAISSLVAAMDPGVKKNMILSNSVHRFWLGVMLSAVNPMQIPFWFGWSTALFSRGLLKNGSSYYTMYIIGIGLGTFLGFLIFIFGGRLLVEKMNANQSAIQYSVAIVFFLTAIFFLIKVLRKKKPPVISEGS
jgi:threonine/homoserine/homoserine lactone efflux protein